MPSMNTFFDSAFEYLMTNEGGGKLVNLPGDDGSWTRYGVSLKFLRNLKKDPSLGKESIEALTEDDAKHIAYTEFWMPLNLDLATDKRVATALLDNAFLAGAPHCSTYAQAALKTLCPYIKIDGKLGPIFWEACNRGPAKLFLSSFISLNSNYFESLAETKPLVKPFLTGWLNRIQRTNTIG